MYEFTCKGVNGLHKLSLITDNFEKFSRVMYLLEELQEDEEKPKFDIEKYRDGNYAMHLETQKMSNVFSRYLDGVGEVWNNGQSYLFVNYWDEYQKDTAYDFNNSQFGSVYEYQFEDYTVLEFTDFDWSDYMEPLETFAPDPIV